MNTCTCTVGQLPNGVGHRTGWQSCPEHRDEAAIETIRQDAIERQAKILFEYLGTYEAPAVEDAWYEMAQWRRDKFIEAARLTNRQTEVLVGIADGKTLREIADENYLSLGHHPPRRESDSHGARSREPHTRCRDCVPDRRPEMTNRIRGEAS